MPERDQGAMVGGYTVIPRTAIFVSRRDSYLLLKGSPSKRLWPGLYNGIGGHIESGEDVLTSACRELKEETGLDADLWLCGTVLVDAGPVGIGLYVLTGEMTGGTLRASPEGSPEWIEIDRVANLPAVEDVPLILNRLQRMQRGDVPFSARSYYDRDGRLRLEFAN